MTISIVNPARDLRQLDMKVDIVLLTLNSVKPCLRKCVESIYMNMPVNRLIVVDGGSTDGTIEYLSDLPNVEIHYDLKGNRATAREMGIGLVQTEWFLFIDSDCILCDGWFEKARTMISPDVGAIQGQEHSTNDSLRMSEFAEAMVKLRKIFSRKSRYGLFPPNERGFTGDVLIRTELVEDIKIPKCLHVYEDYYIKLHIESKGYKWLTPEEPYCDHLNVISKLKDAYYRGFLGQKMGFISLKSAFLAIFTIFPKVIYAFILTRNLEMVFWEIKYQFFTFFGVLKAWITPEIDFLMTIKGEVEIVWT